MIKLALIQQGNEVKITLEQVVKAEIGIEV